MSDQIKTITLNNGRHMPACGLGTFQIKKYGDIEESIDAALASGYRLFDTAAVYKNEQHIGACLSKLLQKHQLTRDSIFITTKLGPKDQGNAEAAVSQSLENLAMSYVDLYLIHWPGKQGLKREDPENVHARKESWIALEDIYLNTAKLKAIGVSNYTLPQLKELLSYCRVKPAVLQSEFHPDYQQSDMITYCEENDIHFQSYSTLGCSHLTNDGRFLSVAKKHSKTIPQVLLRWALQRGCSVIPKSRNRNRIFENINIFDFRLDEDDMLSMTNSTKNIKFAWDPTGVA